mmetsp:Transcript_96054/g.266860  ORF Transcript_96054/g.266860 Transcript_96054/m.266860 type:complete len:280 (+) Transcript_96054:2194-3033(+)
MSLPAPRAKLQAGRGGNAAEQLGLCPETRGQHLAYGRCPAALPILRLAPARASRPTSRGPQHQQRRQDDVQEQPEAEGGHPEPALGAAALVRTHTVQGASRQAQNSSGEGYPERVQQDGVRREHVTRREPHLGPPRPALPFQRSGLRGCRGLLARGSSAPAAPAATPGTTEALGKPAPHDRDNKDFAQSEHQERRERNVREEHRQRQRGVARDRATSVGQAAEKQWRRVCSAGHRPCPINGRPPNCGGTIVGTPRKRQVHGGRPQLQGFCAQQCSWQHR